MQSWGLTDPGCVRKQNQDSYEIDQLDRGNACCASSATAWAAPNPETLPVLLAVDVFVEEVRRLLEARHGRRTRLTRCSAAP